MTGYTRVSTANIVAGQGVNAAPLAAEFNAIEAFANGTTGHAHDGTSGSGPRIDLTTSVTGILPVANGGSGLSSISDLLAIEALAGTEGYLAKTAANTWALRTLTGTANEITVTNGNGTVGAPTFSFPATMSFSGKTITNLGTVTTADINGGTLDGTIIGGASAAAGTFTTLNATGGGALTGTWTNLGTVTTIDINGGTIDGAAIGGNSATVGTFTTLTVNTALMPDTDGGADIGSSTVGFNALHLNTGASLIWDNDTTITFAANTLTFAGSTTYSFDGLIDNTIGQMKFPASQNASADPNTLDDYEEGNFTPAMTFGGSATGVTFTTQLGRYTKIGRLVTFSIQIVLTSNGSGTGTALVTGLPFTASGAIDQAVAVNANSGFSGLTAGVSAYVTAGATTISLRGPSTTGSAVLTETNVTDTANFLIGGSYIV